MAEDTPYTPPTDIWEVNTLLNFEEPLPPEDPLYVETAPSRGDFSFDSLLRWLGIKPSVHKLISAPKRGYAAFCGHRGCGKSTELLRLANELNGAQRFFVVHVDATKSLDINNLEYPDALMAIGKALLERVSEKELKIPSVYLQNLETWFQERVENVVKQRDFEQKIEAGIQAKTGIPLLADLFAKITNSFKVSATYKTELRTTIRNNWSEFANAFNQLLEAVNLAINEAGLGKSLLFILDGPDRLTGEDSKRFFIEDAHQLQAIDGLFIYCCPIHLLQDGNQVQQVFKVFHLPMIKVREKDGEINVLGRNTLRDMALRRADISLFDKPETLDRAVDFSGGNPRELFRLLQLAFSYAERDIFDDQAIGKAMKEVSTSFKRFLHPEDYRILWSVDKKIERDWDAERENFLLYNLALLEYNSFWRASHPGVRVLESYLLQESRHADKLKE